MKLALLSLLIIAAPFPDSATAGDFKDRCCPFTFALGPEWDSQDRVLFQPASQLGERINNPNIPDAAHNEPLETVLAKVSTFHGMVFGTSQDAPTETVSGHGWTGLLQQRGNGEPGTEFQLVARAKTATCVYYMTVSDQTDPVRLAALKAMLLGVRYTP